MQRGWSLGLVAERLVPQWDKGYLKQHFELLVPGWLPHSGRFFLGVGGRRRAGHDTTSPWGDPSPPSLGTWLLGGSGVQKLPQPP